VPEQTAKRPYPALPDDTPIDGLELDSASTSLTLGPMAGFLARLHVYNTMAQFAGADQSLASSERRDLLKDGLLKTKNMIRQLPAELQISSNTEDGALLSFVDLGQFCAALAQLPKRRSVQIDIEKANLHVSLLATRAYFVAKHLIHNADSVTAIDVEPPELADGGEDADTLRQMRDECDFLAHNVLAVMATLPRHSLEPNFHAICTRLNRVIDCALLSRPADDQGEARVLSELRWLQDWLGRTDQALAPGDTATEEDDAFGEALWAELDAWQRRVSGTADGDELPMDLEAIKFEASNSEEADAAINGSAYIPMGEGEGRLG